MRKYRLQSDYMALMPHTFQPVSLYFSYEKSNAAKLLECLSEAHELGLNHHQLIRQLRTVLQSCRNLVQTFSSSICKYLRLNLINNIQILDSVSCLPLIYEYTSIISKRQFTNNLREKYPSNICFYSQILALSCLNLTLIDPFFRLVHSVTQWIQLQIQEKDFTNLQFYEFEYLLNYLYTQERYKYENSLEISGSLKNQTVLSLYRMISDSYSIKNELLTNFQLKERVIHALFYFLCNFDIKLECPPSKYLFYSIGEILKALETNLIDIHNEMAKLIMPKVRNIALEKATREQHQSLLSLLRNAIINVLMCGWTIELEHFWLWRYKLICDLLSIHEKEQLLRINEIRGLFKEISKFINC